MNIWTPPLFTSHYSDLHIPSFRHQLQFSLCILWSRDSLVVEHPNCDQKVMGLSLGRNEGKLSSPVSTFCADSYFHICSIPVLLQ